ncbi:tyrosine-type recombinase/integrase [Desulfomonile tiedjei]|uniref:Site-specific recombinase XerD n=1 Tax=Desulfomonile tiedjei (strain ATCC 49306 / DSM 6799 / DCB-1) TaxID=706587 RepID=I4CE33_DESTA|nr:site-specific integrase [Desulfomonile tiedjei]AFM27824.1 site-specific recombinase XerD [Desulfomonile tiedjei DSM 6799]
MVTRRTNKQGIQDSVWTVYFKPFRDRKIGLKLETTSKREAMAIEAAILRACRSADYSILDGEAREACARMFRNQGWELPECLGGTTVPVEELTLWRAIQTTLSYPDIRDSSNRQRMQEGFAHLVEFFSKGFAVKELWIHHIKEYQRARQAEHAAHSTINKEIAALSKLFQVLIELREIQVNPCRSVKPLTEKNDKRQVYISHADYQRIISALPDWYVPIVQTAYYTGMRRGEILGLTWNRVNLKSRIVYLGPDDVKERNFKRVPIHQDLLPILDRLRKQIVGAEHVFHREGDPITHKYQVRWPWDRIVSKLEGLNPTPHFHDLRHTWKTNARRSGMDMELRESILGHATRGKSISEGYGVISDAELIQAIDRMTFDHGETMIWVPSAKRKSRQGVAVCNFG